jgi:two-component system chemotaxis response regulator CheV
MANQEFKLMNMIDEKARLAGSNKMELLLFSLGGKETFGINVFKVREVTETMSITKTPNMPSGVEGIISLRGSILPVLDLASCLGMPISEVTKTKLIITEFSNHIQGFLVHDVDRIVRVDWDHVKSPQSLSSQSNNKITALTELPDGKLVSIIDVEQIISDVNGDEPLPQFEPIQDSRARSIFYVDDSPVARKRIAEVLDKLRISNQSANNGREGWEKLKALAAKAELDKVNLSDTLGLILADAEMPEMDGYVLTKHIKDDPRFKGIPVVMHSSLSSVANKKLGQQVGVDHYVAKFHPEELANVIVSILSNSEKDAV